MVMLSQVSEQNNKILSWLQLDEKKRESSDTQYPVSFPVVLPMSREEEFLKLEEYLKDQQNFMQMCKYIYLRSGKKLVSTVNDNLRHFMRNKLAMNYNYKGTRGKKAFEATSLSQAIIYGVRNATGIPDAEIANAIKVWLKHAPRRYTVEMKTK